MRQRGNPESSVKSFDDVVLCCISRDFLPRVERARSLSAGTIIRLCRTPDRAEENALGISQFPPVRKEEGCTVRSHQRKRWDTCRFGGVGGGTKFRNGFLGN